jgi:hypothetical protein
MLFLTALLFAVLLFVIPGELVLQWVAGLMSRPGLEKWMALGIMNAVVFALLFVAIRFTSVVMFDLGWENGHLTRRLADWVDVTGWRWLNILGLAAIGAGASILTIEGRLPYPFWFLFAAIVIGLLDVIRGHAIVPLPKVRPHPRFEPRPEPTPEPEPAGKRVVFTWEFCRPGSPEYIEQKKQEFALSEEEYQEARGKDRFPTRPVQEYAKYVRKGFSSSVRRVVEYFRKESADKDYAPIDEVMNLVGFARGIQYKSDEETHHVGDYANFPIETLYDQAGDCEDHAILAATLLYNLGHDVGLFHLDLGESGHLALGYRPSGSTILPAGPFCEKADNGREYYYVETVPTDPSSGVGEISEQFLQEVENRSVVAVT